MSPPSLEFISLPGRGRAESVRLMLVFCSQQFQDTRLTIQQWKFKRESEGFNADTKLPVMKVGDKKKLIGVLEISRFVALNYGLYGSCSADQDQINEVVQVLEALNAQLNPIIRATLIKNYELRKECWDKFKQQSLLPRLEEYEEHLKTHTSIVGTKITWADIALIEMLTRFQCCYDSFYLAHFPCLKAYCTRFESLPNVRPYIQSRPDSYF